MGPTRTSPGLSTETGEPTHDLLKGTDEPSPGLSQGGQTWTKLLRWRVCVGVRSVIDATFSSIPACFGSAMRPLAMVLMQACGETPSSAMRHHACSWWIRIALLLGMQESGKMFPQAPKTGVQPESWETLPQQESHCHACPLPQSRRSHGTAASLRAAPPSPNPPLPSFSGRFPAIRHLRSKGPSPRNGPSRQNHASFRFSFEVAEVALRYSQVGCYRFAYDETIANRLREADHVVGSIAVLQCAGDVAHGVQPFYQGVVFALHVPAQIHLHSSLGDVGGRGSSSRTWGRQAARPAGSRCRRGLRRR